LEQIADSNPVIPIKGLSQTEILVLAIIAGAIPTPTSGIGIYSAKRDAERAGITTMGFNIALRRLTTKKFIEMGDIYDEQNNEPYKGVSISNAGWEWIEENESQFVLHRGEKKGGRQ
jgi:hypothetical protein